MKCRSRASILVSWAQAFTASSMVLTLASCAAVEEGGGATDAGRADSGRADSGESEEEDAGSECGELGGQCCESGSECENGSASCESGTCCGRPRTTGCQSADDCCGDTDCVRGACCILQGDECEGDEDCCPGLVCSEEGECAEAPPECGSVEQPCCEDEETDCGSGLVCADGECAACGGDGEPCCKLPANPCGDELLCSSGVCMPVPENCGRPGQDCCPGATCAGSTRCSRGSCRAEAGDCSAYTTCDGCISDSGCGFCGATGECVAGTSSGPTNGSCASDWARTAFACPVDCTSATDCFSCARLRGCGFCASNNTCMEGSSTGSDDGSCTGLLWSHNSTACRSCDTSSTCSSCALRSRCGFCASTNTCMLGDENGPVMGTCSGEFQDETSECPPPPDPCEGVTTCGECTAVNGCGFCSDGAGDCRSSTEMGDCMSWSTESSSCPVMCSDLQGACTTDSECCASEELSCRQGVTFGVRCCGDAGRSCSSGGDCCGYMDCTNGTCQCRTAGRACLAGGDCCSGVCNSGRCT